MPGRARSFPHVRRPPPARAERDELEIVRGLIDAGVDLNRQSALTEHTALHVAASRGHADILQELLSAGADYSVVNSLGWTPLHTALQSKHLDIARTLIRSGADPRATTKRGIVPRDISCKATEHEIEAVLGLNLTSRDKQLDKEHLKKDKPGVVKWDAVAYEKRRSELAEVHMAAEAAKHEAKRAKTVQAQESANARMLEKKERIQQLEFMYKNTVQCVVCPAAPRGTPRDYSREQ